MQCKLISGLINRTYLQDWFHLAVATTKSGDLQERDTSHLLVINRFSSSSNHDLLYSTGSNSGLNTIETTHIRKLMCATSECQCSADFLLLGIVLAAKQHISVSRSGDERCKSACCCRRPCCRSVVLGVHPSLICTVFPVSCRSRAVESAA